MSRKPRVPSYSLHKPSGLAVVKIKQRSIYLGKFGSDESREAYARIVADLLADRPITPPATSALSQATPIPSLTIGDLVTNYNEHAKNYYRKNGKVTSEVYSIRRAGAFLTANYSSLPAEAFSIGDLKVVRQDIVDSGVARSVVNKYVGRIKRMFNWAATEELVPATVPHALSLLPGLKAGRTKAKETKPVKPVDVEVVNATLPHLPKVVADMVRLQLLTGCRPDEVCNIRPQDIDRTDDVWEYRVDGHKTEHHGKCHTVYIGPEGQDILMPYLLRPADEFCFRPKRHIAVPKKQKRYRRDSYRRAIVRACERAKVPQWSPNRLRHSAATVFRKKGGLEVAQVMLGHSKANTTEIYAERDSIKAREIAALIG